MTKFLAGGFLAVIMAETAAIALGPRWALPVAGVALAAFALALTGRLAGASRADDEPADDGPTESLQRWLAQTTSVISWADSSRADWDRHLRPRLAREFVTATGQKDPADQQETGRMVFGDDLWRWVDPRNVTRARPDEPGPGRAALEEILRRLERI